MRRTLLPVLRRAFRTEYAAGAPQHINKRSSGIRLIHRARGCESSSHLLKRLGLTGIRFRPPGSFCSAVFMRSCQRFRSAGRTYSPTGAMHTISASQPRRRMFAAGAMAMESKTAPRESRQTINVMCLLTALSPVSGSGSGSTLQASLSEPDPEGGN